MKKNKSILKILYIFWVIFVLAIYIRLFILPKVEKKLNLSQPSAGSVNLQER